MKTSDLIQLGLFAGAAYVLYQFFTKQLPKVTQPVADMIANFYTWATLPPAMVVQGNLAFADGSTVPLSTVDVRQNGDMVVASYAGHYYQLSPSDANGNWPATLLQ